tara:strand:- start:672 stop:1187 length:516 start_codon:yes stop_codon:yes gene_type:complete
MEDKKNYFKSSMHSSINLCKEWENGQISDELLADCVGQLIKTKAGARGFFAISLASDCPLMDRLPDALILKLREEGTTIVNLTTKNLAMSSAMAIYHGRMKNELQKSGSIRVTERCIDILRLLDPQEVKICLEKMVDGIKGLGEESLFLEKWNYDKEQIDEIYKSINKVAI